MLNVLMRHYNLLWSRLNNLFSRRNAEGAPHTLIIIGISTFNAALFNKFSGFFNKVGNGRYDWEAKTNMESVNGAIFFEHSEEQELFSTITGLPNGRHVMKITEI